MCLETTGTGCSSPRISFSYDLHQAEGVRVEGRTSRSDTSFSVSDPNYDFDFCTGNHISGEPSSSADELFSDGLLKPLQVPERYVTGSESNPKAITSLPPLPVPLPLPPTKDISSRQENSKEAAEQEQKHHQIRSLWGIRRSSSLHSSQCHKKSSSWSLPFLLMRSNSTGSMPSNSKQVKDNQRQKQPKKPNPASSSIAQKHPLRASLKKNLGGSYGNGIRVSPVLNVSPPYIPRGTANLFGLGSFFGSVKKKKSNN